jgi:(heptosyl)LPS beta-1,4-glucosyltransferase
MNKISAGIVAKNYPKYLKKTIESIKNFVDEIVIFDIGLDKNLNKKLSNNKKNKVVKLDTSIPYVELIREEEKKYLKNDWVLFIDPDEIFPQATLPIIKKEMSRYDCFSFPRKNIIFNHFVKYSRFWPDYQTRLFKKKALIWPKEIHSQPEITGKEYNFEAKEEFAILHYNYENLDSWFDKYLRYAKSEAWFYIKTGKDYPFKKAAKKALNELISRYFASSGYKDGLIGLTLSILQMFYYFIVYFYFLQAKDFAIKEENSPKQLQKFFADGFYESNFWLKEKKLIDKKDSLKTKIANLLIKIVKE